MEVRSGQIFVADVNVSLEIFSVLLVSGDAIDFGSRGTANGPTTGRRIAIENAGPGPVVVNRPILGGVDAAEFVLDTSAWTAPSMSVPQGSSISCDVAFDPTLKLQRNATVTFTHDGSGVPATFAVNVTSLGTQSVIGSQGGGGGGGGGGCCSAGAGRDAGLPILAGLLALAVALARRGSRRERA